MLQRINSELRGKTNLKQWRRTSEARDWFINLNNKQELTFIKFDVESFYPSISEELVRSAFEWAGTMVEINQEEKDVTNKTKMSLLFVRGKYRGPHIGARHPVLYFTIQATENYKAATY